MKNNGLSHAGKENKLHSHCVTLPLQLKEPVPLHTSHQTQIIKHITTTLSRPHWENSAHLKTLITLISQLNTLMYDRVLAVMDMSAVVDEKTGSLDEMYKKCCDAQYGGLGCFFFSFFDSEERNVLIFGRVVQMMRLKIRIWNPNQYPIPNPIPNRNRKRNQNPSSPTTITSSLKVKTSHPPPKKQSE